MALTDWRVKILGRVYDFTLVGKTSWSVDVEETLGSPGTATFRWQDRDDLSAYPDAAGDFPSIDPGGIGFTLEEMDTIIEIEGSDVPLFHGKILRDAVDLPEAVDWRFHTLSATDYQREVFARRNVGIPNGDTWTGPDSDGNYINVDPNALIDGGTDASVVQALIAAYCPTIFGNTIDTTTFVKEYISNVGFGVPYTLDKTKLRGALDYVAGQVGGNLQYWLDPADRLHWIVLPRWFENPTDAAEAPSARLFPQSLYDLEAAPVDINNDDPDGVTSVGCRNLKYAFDYGNIVHQWYVTGALGWEYNGGAVVAHGTGWVSFGADSGPSSGVAQDYLDAPWATTIVDRVAAANRATALVDRGLLTGSCTIGNERHHPDGFHVGQLIRITDHRLPPYLNGRRFVIQKVSTQLVPETNWRVYKIEWGDAPSAKASSRRAQSKDQTGKDPGRLWDIVGRDMNPLPGSTITIVGQLIDEKGDPKRVAGIVVNLVLSVWDETGTPVTGVGSISPTTAVTNEMGYFETQMTVGSQLGYRYRVDVV